MDTPPAVDYVPIIPSSEGGIREPSFAEAEKKMGGLSVVDSFLAGRPRPVPKRPVWGEEALQGGLFVLADSFLIARENLLFTQGDHSRIPPG